MLKGLLIIILFSNVKYYIVQCERSFFIDYENDCFLMDGQPFRYISGSMHYFRVPQEHWDDRFAKMKAAGLNAVQTYIEWSQHEPEPQVYNFDGNLDFVSFINTAADHGLYVILRAGPYICAERDMGGLPYWLLRENSSMILRTHDPSYLTYVDLWMDKLLPMIKPLLYINGGPILTVQVENEYGSYYACDWDYMNHMRDMFRSYLGNEVVLFTTDGNADSFLNCGKTQGLYATVDFGPGESVNDSFHAKRNHEPKGPLVNSEYYTCGHTRWGYPANGCDIDQVIETLEEMLDLNASINMYMFHGGTSFGFTNGANLADTYWPDTTSYDFGAPLTESGDVTELYDRIREILQKYNKDPLPPVPEPTPMFAYGEVSMQFMGTLFEFLPLLASSPPVFSELPLTFEALSQAYGFVLYETILPCTFMDPALLFIRDLRDRGYVFLDHDFVGILSRTGSLHQLPITAKQNQTLSILVENQGRVNYGTNLNDFQGLLSTPNIDQTPLKSWKMTRLPFNNTKLLEKTVSKMQNGKSDADQLTSSSGNNVPGIYSGNFTLPENLTEPQDTFLLTPGWEKGIAFLNGFNLGRYWPGMGPQVTLYVPKGILRPFPEDNTLIIFELQHSTCAPSSLPSSDKWMSNGNEECLVIFLDHAILNGTTPNAQQKTNQFYAGHNLDDDHISHNYV